MPEYAFMRLRDRREIRHVMPMRDAIPIGDTLVIDGEECVRLVSPGVLVNGNPVSGRYPYAARAINRNAKGVKERTRGGIPVIQNREHERVVCELNGYEKQS